MVVLLPVNLFRISATQQVGQCVLVSVTQCLKNGICLAAFLGLIAFVTDAFPVVFPREFCSRYSAPFLMNLGSEDAGK